MTWPTAATKVNLDQASDDPKQARTELADLVDQFNTLRSHITSYMQTLLDDTTAGAAQITLGLVIGTDVQADLDVPSDAEADAGTATTERVWTAAKIKRSIDALASGGLASGTRAIFHQTAAPTGWTRDVASTYNDVALRVMASGTWVAGPTGTTGVAAHWAAGLTSGTHAGTAPSHSHTMSTNFANVGDSTTTDNWTTASLQTPTTKSTGSAGGGSHDHTYSLAVKYTDVIIAARD